MCRHKADAGPRGGTFRCAALPRNPYAEHRIGRSSQNPTNTNGLHGEIELLTHYAEPNMVLDYPGWSPDGARVDFSIARKRGDLYILARD